MAASWSLLALGDEREFQGNDGYEDVVDSYYVFDSTVPNHGKVAVDDVVLIRGRTVVLGAAVVERIDVERGLSKTRLRCPHCTKTGFKRRQHKSPEFRCASCATEFDEPASEVIGIDRYTAHYRSSWRTLDGAVSVAQLARLSLANASQHAIRELDSAGVRALLDRASVHLPVQAPSGRHPALPGGSTRALVKVRKGQPAFRSALLLKYGLVCAVTGPCPAEALQAAHLRGFAVHERHSVDEGLLLRADIHHLFDSGLLAIDPDSLVVRVDPRLADYPDYKVLDGRALAIPSGLAPDRSAIRDHYRATLMGA